MKSPERIIAPLALLLLLMFRAARVRGRRPTVAIIPLLQVSRRRPLLLLLLLYRRAEPRIRIRRMMKTTTGVIPSTGLFVNLLLLLPLLKRFRFESSSFVSMIRLMRIIIRPERHGFLRADGPAVRGERRWRLR